MSVAAVSANSSSSANEPVYSDGNDSISLDDMLKVIVANMANQNPENSADVNQILTNYMTMANFQATQSSSANVTKMYEQQLQVLSASLVGKGVEISPADGSGSFTGLVSSSRVVDDAVKITVGGTEYDMSEVASYQPAPTATP